MLFILMMVLVLNRMMLFMLKLMLTMLMLLFYLYMMPTRVRVCLFVTKNHNILQKNDDFFPVSQSRKISTFCICLSDCYSNTHVPLYHQYDMRVEMLCAVICFIYH